MKEGMKPAELVELLAKKTIEAKDEEALQEVRTQVKENLDVLVGEASKEYLKKLNQDKKIAFKLGRRGDAAIIQKEIETHRWYIKTYAKTGDSIEHDYPDISSKMNWPELPSEKIQSLRFLEFSQKTRRQLVAYLVAEECAERKQYDFPDANYMNYLLDMKNVEKIPEQMKDGKHYFFIKPTSGRGGKNHPFLPYVAWDDNSKSLRKYFAGFWDHWHITTDRVVVAPK